MSAVKVVYKKGEQERCLMVVLLSGFGGRERESMVNLNLGETIVQLGFNKKVCRVGRRVLHFMQESCVCHSLLNA